MERPRSPCRRLRRAAAGHRRRPRRALKLLLDTHAALWWLSDDERLGATSAKLMTDASNQVLLSAAVVWEVAIKRSLGKLDAPDDFAGTLLGAGARPLPVGIDHTEAVGELAWHHRDPFDRLLVAQATVEQAVVVSNDEALQPYRVPLVW
ncbi:MAG: type II toxin-antitoxin system VapC family toxin [Thermoleophilaceae bacterium]